VVGVAATCLLLGFLAGHRTGSASDKQDGREGAVARTSEALPSTRSEQDPRPEEVRLRVGKSYRQFDGRTTTAARFLDPVPLDTEHGASAEGRWVGLEIESCADAEMSAKNAFSVSALDWTLLDAHGTHLRPERLRHAVSARPLYPVPDVPVHPGECVRGWVVWELPDRFSTTTALFTPTPTWFAPQGGGTIEWTVP
jgi:hypothetical protein